MVSLYGLGFLLRQLHTTFCTLPQQALGGYSALTPPRPPDPILGESTSPGVHAVGSRAWSAALMSTRVLWDASADRQTAHPPHRSHRCVQERHGEEQGQPRCRCVWRLCAVSLRQIHLTLPRPHCLHSQDASCHPHPAFFCAVIVVWPEKLTITAFLSDSAYRL
jgi:hypothetical protein